MVIISFRLSRQLLAELDDLVNTGTFANRAEAIRSAIRNLLLIEQMATDTPANVDHHIIQLSTS
ncbi:MAG: ribbon-helix-helix domain-containing protein [Promethearchaeota archaeon]